MHAQSPSGAPDADFASFLAEVAREVEAYVDPWRVRIGEAVARWQAEGVATEVLERALALPAAPDVDGLLATFATAVARLRTLESDAAAHDPALAGHAAFRDPARLPEAQSLARRAARGHAARTAAPVLDLDPETFVVEWLDIASLVVEEYR